MSNEHLRDELHIDKDDLDNELVRQPSLFANVGQQYAEAVSVRDNAKDELKRVCGELYLVVSDELSKEGGRVTETKIDSSMRQKEEHTQAKRDLDDAERLVNELESLKDAFRQRSFILRDLVSLYIANYYADGSAGVTERIAKDASYENNKEQIKQARRTRKRKKVIDA